MNWLVVGALAEDAAGTGKMTWLQGAVAKFTETPPEAWIVFGVILLAGILLLAGSRGGKRNARIAGYGLVAIALSFVLSCITLYRMPDGGSVTAASMLPVMLFAAACGVGPGFLAGLLYGVLQAMQGGILTIGAGPLILDYLLPFGLLCLAGLAKELPESWGIYPSIVAAALARILCHTMAGVQFWETATMASFEYNITYLGPDTVICILLAFLIAKPVIRFIRQR